jgi:outer membrane protein OmpA-like peptidoglycan-associated protein
MIVNIRQVYFCCILTATTLLISGFIKVKAADPDIQINNSVLDNYEPPPMFSEESKPELSRPIDSDWEPRLTGERKKASGKDVISSQPSTEELLEKNRVKSENTVTDIIKKHKSTSNTSETVYPLAPLPPRKEKLPGPLKEKAVLSAPLPEKKPESNKTGSSGQLVLARPEQTDVPEMPSLPAGPVKTEVLFSAPKPEKKTNRSPAEKKASPEPEKINNQQKSGRTGGNSFSLDFKQGQTDLDLRLKDRLGQKVASIVKEGDSFRLLIKAFALPADDSRSSAKRVSLSRALAVRSFIMDRGINPVNIEVRAMGSNSRYMPLDRVDIIFLKTEESG